LTRFLSLRAQDVGGPIVDPFVVDCDPGPSLIYRPAPAAQAARDAAGKDLILAIHGFNVSRPNGVRTLGALEPALRLEPHQAYFGVLWPGDFWLPAVNYPWGASEAVHCGRRLAAFLNGPFAQAASLSFISHSLGGRVLLETVKNLDRPAREVCIAAGAVDDDCLQVQYAAVKAKAGRISVLSSTKDKVLRLAYPAGDFLSDLFYDNDSPWAAALGLKGPRPAAQPPVAHQPIPPAAGYDHGDYLPPSDPPAVPPANPKWRTAADFMRRAVDGEPQRWP
jgi:hypothetical protein